MKSILAIFFLLIAQSSSAQSWLELNNMAVALDKKGDLVAALNYAKKAIDKAKTEFGETHINYVKSLELYGVVTHHAGDYKAAENNFLNAKSIVEKNLGKNHEYYAFLLTDLGVLYIDMALYSRAEQVLIESKETFEKNNNKASSEYMTCVGSLGVLYDATKEYKKARIYFEIAYAYAKTNFKKDEQSYFYSLINLSTACKNAGEFIRAEALLIEAKEGITGVSGKQNTLYTTCLNNLGDYYSSIGQHQKALPFLIEATEINQKILTENHPDYARSLVNLATLYLHLEKYNLALAPCNKAFAIYKALNLEQTPMYAGVLQTLGTLYQLLGETKQSEQYYLNAANVSKQKFGTNHPEFANGLNQLGLFYHRSRDYEKALQFFSLAIKIIKNNYGDIDSRYINYPNNLASTFSCLNQNDTAAKIASGANRSILKNTVAIFPVLSQSQKEEILQSVNYNRDFLSSLLYHSKEIGKNTSSAGYESEIETKSLALSETKNLLQLFQNSQDTAIRQLYSRWLAIKKMLAKQYSLPKSNRAPDLAKGEQMAEDMERELNKKSSVFRTQDEALKINKYDVQKNLMQEEVAIEFVRFQIYNKYWTDSVIYGAYILNKKDPDPVFIPLFEEQQLQQLLNSSGKSATATAKVFYRGLEIKNKNTKQGAELYKLIWQPLEPYLKGVKKISYSPAGKLFGIAFHALPVDSSSLLMEKYQLQQYTSTRQIALRAAEPSIKKPANIILFGDADFSMDSLQLVKQRIKQKGNNTSGVVYTPSTRSENNNSWPALPGTAEEVDKIKTLFAENKITSKTYKQTEASEENLKFLNDNSPQVLHIATHGFFLPQADKKKENNSNNSNQYSLANDPLLRSGLILSGGNYVWNGKIPVEGVEDGIVTAYEISQLNLSNTELVVLSACETALGDVKGSEGVFGLQRAFKMAGVKKMIVSLWQVPDKETAELMTSFYTYWIKGNTIEEAFSQAQADMRKKYSPFYWAAFVLVE